MLPATLALAFLGCTHTQLSLQSRSLVGAWRSAVHFDSGPLASVTDLEFLYVFNLGGTLTESSNYDSLPPVAPAYGAWKNISPGQFEARYEFFITKPPAQVEELTTGGGWLPAGRGILSEQIRIAPDGLSFESAIQYQALNADGSPAPGAASGHGRAVKIQL